MQARPSRRRQRRRRGAPACRRRPLWRPAPARPQLRRRRHRRRRRSRRTPGSRRAFARAGRSSARTRLIDASAAAGFSRARSSSERPGSGSWPSSSAWSNASSAFAEVSEAQPHLADLGVARRRDPRRPAREQLCRLGRSPLRVLELALVAHHLGAVDPADARERSDRVLVAEELGPLGPLRRLVERGHVAARPDRVAVDDDGVVRPERAAVRGCVHLVEQQPALVDLPEMDQRHGSPLPAAQLERQVAVLAADPLRRLAQVSRGRVVVSPAVRRVPSRARDSHGRVPRARSRAAVRRARTTRSRRPAGGGCCCTRARAAPPRSRRARCSRRRRSPRTRARGTAPPRRSDR